MTDLGPHRKRIAQLVRLVGSIGGERRNAFAALERVMESAGIGWTDIGDAIEGDGDGKFTEAEMQELAQIARAEGVADGIKIGQARTSNGGSNGHLTLPQADEMAHYCHQRLSQLKNDREREFIDEMVVKTRRGRSLSPRTLGYLASIYIGIGGRV